MTYLDLERLNAVDADAFQAQRPFPFVNPQGLLTDDGHRRLLETLPDVSLFERSFGVDRKYGQQSHDRFALEYGGGLDLAQPWRDFIAELKGDAYRAFVRRMFGIDSFDMNFHWHYAPNGCSVSPHCDSKRKYGSHLFYLDDPEDWDPAWGGQTLVLEDGGRFPHESAPDFEDFEREVAAAQTLGNYSFMFRRTAHSWHGVREIRCPQDRMRKLFIAVINRATALLWLRRLVGDLPKGY